jgi:hypothetical protein
LGYRGAAQASTPTPTFDNFDLLDDNNRDAENS